MDNGRIMKELKELQEAAKQVTLPLPFLSQSSPLSVANQSVSVGSFGG